MIHTLSNNQERQRFLRFSTVGISGAALDFAMFNLLILVFSVLPIWANVGSFTVAVTSNFVLNRFWTYPDSRSKRVTRQLAQYVVVNLIGVVLRTGIFALIEPPIENLYEWLHLNLPFPAEIVGHNLALATAIIVVLFWNFFVNRYWTYGDVAKELRIKN